MTQDPPVPPDIEVNIPSPARIYDFLLGGKDNFATDRAEAEKMLAREPRASQIAHDNRGFLVRAVGCAVQEGITQFLDIGTGLPTRDNVHEVARRETARRGAPAARIVYVDNDPVVLSHARALLANTGGVTAVKGDLRDPAAVLGDPRVREMLDFRRPIAVLLVAILHFLADRDDPWAIVRHIVSELAPGSLLIASHGTADANPAARQVARNYSASMPLLARTRSEILRFFDGLDLLEPGLTWTYHWRPEEEPRDDAPRRRVLYGGVGRKPG
jgi:hypothetical protein